MYEITINSEQLKEIFKSAIIELIREVSEFIAY
ncbi:hypothetical protein [Nostoc sp. DSM 114159]|jgi:hypothetical protein